MDFPLTISKEKLNILDRLQREIMPLQVLKRILVPANFKVFPRLINNTFPNAQFPLGAIHEFISTEEDVTCTSGFISGILASIMRNSGVSIWISSDKIIFPPALKLFGIEPNKIIFIELHNEKEVLWAMEEALKCDFVSAVVGELKELSFTNSRRLQLAVEQSQVTGFILRNNPRNVNTTACVTRWKITSLPSEKSGMPGVGFPRWNVELLKIRNGRPGSWQIEFADGCFSLLTKIATIPLEQKKKTG